MNDQNLNIIQKVTKFDRTRKIKRQTRGQPN